MSTLKSPDVPATQAMLFEMRDEMKLEDQAREHRMNAKFEKIFSLFHRVDERFDQVDARFEQVDARFEQVDSRFEQVDASFKQVGAHFKLVNAQFEDVYAELKELDSKVEDVKASVCSVEAKVHKSNLLAEVRNVENKYVLDGHTAIVNRIDDMEHHFNDRINQIEDVIKHKK